MTEPKRGSETREEGDVNPRAIESVKDYVHERMKMSEKQKGILHREEGKLAVVERQPQTEGAWSREERKAKLVEEQTIQSVQAVREMGCRSRLGPTGMGQQLSGVWGEEKSAGGCWRRRAQQNFSPSRGP